MESRKLPGIRLVSIEFEAFGQTASKRAQALQKFRLRETLKWRASATVTQFHRLPSIPAGRRQPQVY
jgi:hypothetical protein